MISWPISCCFRKRNINHFLTRGFFWIVFFRNRICRWQPRSLLGTIYLQPMERLGFGFRVYHGFSWFIMVYHGLSQLKFRMGSKPFSVIIPLGSSHRKSNQQPCPTNGVRIGSINCRQSTYLQLHPSVPNNLSDPIVKYIPCFILSIYTGICIIFIYILYTHMLYLHTKHCSSGHLRHAGDILLAGRCRQDCACEGLVKPGNDPLYGVKSKPNPL